MLSALALLALTLAADPAAADPAAAPPPAAPRPATPPDLSLDFDLLARPSPAAAPDAAALEARVKERRWKLRLHQGLGLATWTALAATVVVGQLDFDDRFRGGGDTGRYHRAHKLLAYSSAGLFAGTAALALMAPEPYAKRTGRLDGALVHKIAMGTAAAGMVAQVALGLASRHAAGTVRERSLASVHQVVGYATLGAMTVGGLSFVF
jgi:hypothetical protein